MEAERILKRLAHDKLVGQSCTRWRPSLLVTLLISKIPASDAVQLIWLWRNLKTVVILAHEGIAQQVLARNIVIYIHL